MNEKFLYYILFIVNCLYNLADSSPIVNGLKNSKFDKTCNRQNSKTVREFFAKVMGAAFDNNKKKTLNKLFTYF